MRKNLITLVFLVFFITVAFLSAQTSRLETFQSNFSSANLQTRLEILRAADHEDPAEYGPLYLQAITHVINNGDSLFSEPLLREMAMLATNRISDGAYTPAAADLWRLFQIHQESSYRIRCLEVLSEIGGTTPAVVEGINDWVRRQHLVSQGGGRPDLQVLAAAVDALGHLGDPLAFTALIDTVLLQYPGFVTAPARQSLAMLEGDSMEQSLAALRGRPLLERRPLFILVLSAGFLSDQERFELSRNVLRDTLNVSTGDSSAAEEARQIRFAATRVLREGAYSTAAPEILLHFNQTLLEFERGRIPGAPLLEAIAALGAMGTEEAVSRLTQYLELLNTYTETDRPYDTQIVLAVINNLELLGSPASYNALFYTTLLENYPSTVRERARQAAASVTR